MSIVCLVPDRIHLFWKSMLSFMYEVDFAFLESHEYLDDLLCSHPLNRILFSITHNCHLLFMR